MFEYNLPIAQDLNPFPILPSPSNNTDTPFSFLQVAQCPNRAKRKRSGWSDETQLKYLAFICLFRQEMACLQGKDMWAYYKMMSQFIKCKNPNQCRIFHKQLLKQHHTIEAILSFYALPITVYSSTFKHYAQEINKMVHPSKVDQKVNIEAKSVKNNNSYTSISLPTDNKIGESLQYEKKEQLAPTALAYQEELQGNSTIPTRGRIEKVARPFGSFFQSLQEDIPKDKRQDWLQCHRLFLAWTTKLNSLLAQE